MEHQRNHGNIIIGLILILIGVAYLVDNYGIFNFNVPNFLFRWETILIIIGLFLLFSNHFKTSGIILIIIGFIGFFPKLWPLILVGIGLYLIFKNKSFVKGKNISSADYFNIENFLHGCIRKITSQNLSGGEVATIFGSCKIDFKNAQLAEGENIIELFAMFGSVVLIVPSDWSVEIRVEPIFGGFRDRRKVEPQLVQDPTKKLVIKGFVLFSGGEIKTA